MFTFILLFSLLFNNLTCVEASSNETYFARIMQDDVCLYKSPTNSNDTTNIFFTLPKTYFVELQNLINDEFYEVQYLGIKGYVKKDAVQAVEYAPEKPYLNDVSFRVYAELSRDLRSEPNTTSGSSSQLAYIPLLSRNLSYIGQIEGECLIEGRTNIWYYCKFTADKDYYGYVYSDFCDEMSPILDNTEEVTYIANPDFKPEEVLPTSMPTNNKNVGIIIAILAVPTIVFLFMIIKSKNILSSKPYKDKEIIDY